MYFLKEEIKWFPNLWPLSLIHISPGIQRKNSVMLLYTCTYFTIIAVEYQCIVEVTTCTPTRQTYDVCPLTTFVTIEILNQWPTPIPTPHSRPPKMSLPSILSSQVIEFFPKKNIHKYFYFGHISITTAFLSQEPPVFPPF